jgi:hypothetical protein
VLINNKSFDGYKGLDLNFRTEKNEGGLYSFLLYAVVRVGAGVLEVQKDQSLFFNKQRIYASSFTLLVGGLPATHEVTNKCFAIGPIHKCASAVTVDVQLGEQEHIIMKVFKDMVHVEVTCRPQEMAVGSVMLMGTYPAKRHGCVDRDGFTFVRDANVFGQEWQVRDVAFVKEVRRKRHWENGPMQRVVVWRTPPKYTLYASLRTSWPLEMR